MIKKLAEKAKAAALRATQGSSPKGGAPGSLGEISLIGLDGTPRGEALWAGKVVLFVNVASRCGLTPQYAQLAELHRIYSPRGFEIVGVPCNQFLGQEPGTADEIRTFCSVTYGVDFPLLEKQDVNGPGRSPLFQWLVESEAGGGDDIRWNFEKFLVGRNGEVVARFAPQTTPDAPEVVEAIEAAL